MIVDVENPSLNITLGLAEIVDVEADASPGLTSKLLLVPVSEPEEFVAVIVQVPMLETDTVWEDKTPDTKLAVVPSPAPRVQLEEIFTVPVKVFTVSGCPSTATTVMLKDFPVCLLEMFPEGARSTLN